YLYMESHDPRWRCSQRRKLPDSSSLIEIQKVLRALLRWQGLLFAFANRIGWSFFSQAKSHNRVSLESGRMFRFLDQTGFKLVRIRNHFTGGNLFIACAVIAKLANAKSAFRARAYRRTKCPAGHGTSRVQIAPAGLRVESRAGLFFAKGGEAFQGCIIFGKNSGCRIARERSF